MFQRFNTAPLWARSLLFAGILGGPFSFWWQKSGGTFYQTIASKKQEIESLQHGINRVQAAATAQGLEILQENLVKREDFANILLGILPEFSKKTLNNLQTGSKHNLMDYLDGKAAAGKFSAPAVPDPVQALLAAGGLSNPVLLAQETKFELTDSFLNLHKLLKKAEKEKGVFWREITIDVKNAPQSVVGLKIFTISKE
ncbi:MAG: hypothetical protein FJX18_07255 [Alphaproteobacteria bacterium]|nr:hypothetical protein [Alphaproteobacteria bacterium]